MNPPIYYVMIRLTMDDIIVGCYAEKGTALRRANRLSRMRPNDLRRTLRAHCTAWDVTGVVIDAGVQVYRMRGARPATMIQSYDFKHDLGGDQ